MISARRLTLAAASVALLASTALVGCSNQQAGSAVTFTDGRITEAELTAQVEEILEAKGQAPTATDPTLVQQTLGRMITIRLVNDLAVASGIDITQGILDEMRLNYEAQLGGPEALEQAFLAENVAPSQIDATLILQLQAQELGYVLNPSGAAEEQGMAVFQAVSALSEEIDTTVSPRFGTWDPMSLSLGPVPNDLSTPPVVQ